MDDFLRKQDKRVQAATEASLQRILRILRKTRAEVIVSLLDSPSDFQEISLLSTLKNIDKLLAELRGELGEAYREIAKESAHKGYDDQVEVLEKFFSHRLDKFPEIALIGAVELSVLKAIDLNIDTFLQKFTSGVREKIANTIQQGMIHGRKQGEVIQAIRENFNSQLNTTKRAVHHIYQTSYNLANQEVLEDLAKSVPGLKKQWWSMIDKDTTTICNELNEQVQAVDLPFIHKQSGSRWMQPPAVYGSITLRPQFHFCRSRAVPYLPE